MLEANVVRKTNRDLCKSCARLFHMKFMIMLEAADLLETEILVVCELHKSMGAADPNPVTKFPDRARGALLCSAQVANRPYSTGSGVAIISTSKITIEGPATRVLSSAIHHPHCSHKLTSTILAFHG